MGIGFLRKWMVREERDKKKDSQGPAFLTMYVCMDEDDVPL